MPPFFTVLTAIVRGEVKALRLLSKRRQRVVVVSLNSSAGLRPIHGQFKSRLTQSVVVLYPACGKGKADI